MSESNDVTKNEKVLILGWYASQKTHVQKYGPLWEEQGYEVVYFWDHSYQYPLDQTKKCQKIVAKLIETIHQEQPTVVHLFSNGAGWVWSYALATAVGHVDEKKQVKLGKWPATKESPFPSVNRVVMDSLPSAFYMRDIPCFWSFVWSLSGKNKFLHLLWYLCYVPGTLLMGLFQLCTLRFLPRFNPTEMYWAGLIHGAKALRCPQLLIFSRDDKLVPAARVRTLASEMEKVGVQVTTKEFHPSDHVAHYRHHKKDYTSLVAEFVGGASSAARLLLKKSA